MKERLSSTAHVKSLLYFIVGFFSLRSCALSAPIPVSIQTTIDTTIATIGDRIHLTVHLTYPEGTRFEFPFIEKTLGDMEVRATGFSDPKKIEGGFSQDWNLELAVYDTGFAQIPALEIRVKSQTDTTNVIVFNTDPQTVRVISVLPPGSTDLKDIKPPFPIRWIPSLRLFFLIVIVILICVGAWLYYRRWKKQHPVIIIDERFIEPPHIVAFEKLNQLKDQVFNTAEEQLEFYIQISQIIREYIERRFFIRALEMTSSEIIPAVEKSPAMAREKSMIRDLGVLLSDLDVIKFARQIPPIEKIPVVLEETYCFVDKTKREYFLNRRTM